MHRGRSMVRLILVAVLAVAGLGGAFTGVAPAAPEGGFTPQSIAWSPRPDNPEVECGTLTLPVDCGRRRSR
jgi:hypothetical protein